MFTVLPWENWAIVYKLLLLVTAVFHTSKNIRVFCSYFILSWCITGLLKEHYFDGSNWFMVQCLHELITLLLAQRLLRPNTAVYYYMHLQALFFLSLNIMQFQTLSDWFMKPEDYIWWNMIGFELILLSLWWNSEVLSAIKRRWTTHTAILTILASVMIYFAGNY